MKILKYALLLCFVAVLVGIFSQALLYIPNARGIMAFALFLIVIFGTINFILSIKNKHARIEASMISSSSVIILGLLFTTMYWKGGAVMLIIGSSIHLFSAIALTILSFKNKTKKYTGLLYLALSMNSMLFLFKTMFWSMPLAMYITVPISLLIFIYVLIKLKAKLNLPQIVISIIYFLIIIFTISNENKITRFKHISLNQEKPIENWKLYRYAWFLKDIDQKEEALIDLNLALNDIHHELMYSSFQKLNRTGKNSKTLINQRIVIKKSIELLKENKWNNKEKFPYQTGIYKGSNRLEIHSVNPNFTKAWELYNENQKEEAIKMLTLTINNTTQNNPNIINYNISKNQFNKAIKLAQDDIWTKLEYEEAYINIRYNIEPTHDN